MNEERDAAPIAGRYRVIEEGPIEARGVDDASGAPVVIRPAATGGITEVKFLEQEELERIARMAMSLDTPWRLAVLCPAPRVVYAAPPPAVRPEAPLATADAAECLLQLCDVLARAHAAGEAGFGADVHDVRVHREDGAWRITAVLPHLPPRGRWSHAVLPPWWLSSVQRDLWTAVSFFRDLLLGRVPRENDRFRDEDPPLPPFGDDAVHVALSAVLSLADTTPENIAAKDIELKDIAALAECVLPLCRSSADWRPRVAAMPRVRSVKGSRDWDRLIALGEEERAARRHPNDPYLCYPLAAAYHQRGCVANARGDLDLALRDVEQAIVLDRWPRYLVTRGVLHAGLGDPEGASSDDEEAVSLSRAPAPPEDERMRDPDLVSPWEWPGARPFEGARALYARGVTRHRKGDLDGARSDLNEALTAIAAASDQISFMTRQGDLDALRRTVLRALVPVYRAAIRAEPAASRWRWPLVRTLRDLGREGDARAEADRTLALFPDVEAERNKYAKIFRQKAASGT